MENAGEDQSQLMPKRHSRKTTLIYGLMSVQHREISMRLHISRK